MAGIWVYSEDTSVLSQLLSIGRVLADGLKENVGAINLFDDSAAADIVSRGADKVISLTGESLWAEGYAEAITEQLAQAEPTVILVGGTLRGKDVAAKVAAKLKVGLVNSATDIKVDNGQLVTNRIMYGGLAVCTEELGKGCIVTIDPRTYEESQADASRTGETVTVAAKTDDKAKMVGDVCPIVRQTADISEAQKVVCVGRGVGKQEDMKLAENLADKLGAEIGCTRSIAEDYHWLPVESYIGLSGAKTKPELYISFGVSGQIQHVAGIRDSKIIVAIDTNEKAPIFEAADYGIVGDLYEIVPLLTEKIAK